MSCKSQGSNLDRLESHANGVESSIVTKDTYLTTSTDNPIKYDIYSYISHELLCVQLWVALIKHKNGMRFQHEVLPQCAVECGGFTDSVHEDVMSPTDNQTSSKLARLVNGLSNTSVVIYECSPMNLRKMESLVLRLIVYEE